MNNNPCCAFPRKKYSRYMDLHAEKERAQPKLSRSYMISLFYYKVHQSVRHIHFFYQSLAFQE